MPHTRKFTAKVLSDIHERFHSGETAIEIAAYYAVSRQRMYELLRLADPETRLAELERDRERKARKYWDNPEAARRYYNNWYRLKTAQAS